jgi:protein-tyrosine-phosphatase
MNMKKLHIIEVVCTGNNGRSPMAEVIGNYFISSMGLENRLCFISSGTRADPGWDTYPSYSEVVSILNKASRHGLMKAVDVDEDKYKNDPAYRMIIQEKVHMAFRIMRPIEAALRDAALYDIGLRYNGKRTQTRARDDISLVLGMESRHITHLNEIYSRASYKPPFNTLTKYGGIIGEIPDFIGNPHPSVCFKIKDILHEVMPKVINRFKKEYHL